jgi:hypothetical protein
VKYVQPPYTMGNPFKTGDKVTIRQRHTGTWTERYKPYVTVTGIEHYSVYVNLDDDPRHHEWFELVESVEESMDKLLEQTINKLTQLEEQWAITLNQETG